MAKSLKDEKFPTLADFAELTEPRFAAEMRALLPSYDSTVDAAEAFLRDRTTTLTPDELARYVHVAGLRYVAGKTRQAWESEQVKQKKEWLKLGSPYEEAAQGLRTRPRGDKRHMGDDYFIATMYVAFAKMKGKSQPGWAAFDGIDDNKRIQNELSRFCEHWLKFVDPDRRVGLNLATYGNLKKKLGLVKRKVS